MAKRKLNNSRALRIVAAAREEFAWRGFEGARVDRIARSAGVNKQLLFYYFRSKRGLFQAVLAQAAAELESALDAVAARSGPPLERLHATLAAQFDFLARRPELAGLLTHAAQADVAPFAPAVRRLVVLVAEGQGRGQVRDDVDPHLVAAQALVLMLGFLRLEGRVTASARTLAADEAGLRSRWQRAAADLVVAGVRAGR
jgi:AcrR family transcriptional regulator